MSLTLCPAQPARTVQTVTTVVLDKPLVVLVRRVALAPLECLVIHALRLYKYK